MFNSLVLTNFRKHVDASFSFSQGVVAIRGANEASKTTLLESIAYAMFGATALRQTFSECVTWGKPEASLSVTLVFTFDGVQYTITRKKSGAELNYAGGKVTGQTEVTKFCETLLGANADTASKMMVASQGSLRGALTGGPKEAAALIEHLANFRLIEQVVELIVSNLPTGNTKAVEANIVTAAAALEACVVAPLDIEAETLSGDALNTELGDAYATQRSLTNSLQDINEAGARATLNDVANKKCEIEELRKTAAELLAERDRLISLPAHTLADIEIWRSTLANSKQASAVLKAYTELQALQVPLTCWEGTRASFDAELKQQADHYKAVYAEFNAQRTAQTVLRSRLITEQSCAFCGKELQAVPEVIEHNVKLNAEMVALETKVAALKTEIDTTLIVVNELEALQAAALSYERLAGKFAAYATFSDTRVPFECVWTGEPPVAGNASAFEYVMMIENAEKALVDYGNAVYLRDNNVARGEAAKGKLEALEREVAGLETLVEGAAERVKQAEFTKTSIADWGTKLTDLKGKLQMHRQAVDHKVALHAAQVQQRSMFEVQLQTASATLKSMNFNNELVKKVRSARPIISDKLWSVVLASVSHYFSQIRGVKSSVTRSDNGFKVDGQSVGGLSGSTLDALGLAIRIALTKTFLPNARFMMLDEVASACDDERETNMLGVLASADFDQILLVTHSSLADAFAAQIVSL